MQIHSDRCETYMTFDLPAWTVTPKFWLRALICSIFIINQYSNVILYFNIINIYLQTPKPMGPQMCSTPINDTKLPRHSVVIHLFCIVYDRNEFRMSFLWPVSRIRQLATVRDCQMICWNVLWMMRNKWKRPEKHNSRILVEEGIVCCGYYWQCSIQNTWLC